MSFKVFILVLTFVAAALGAAFSGTPTLNTNSPSVFSKLEISFNLANSYSNVYDTSQIDVGATFVSAGFSQWIPCFPFQQYTQSSSNSWSASGSRHWLCRFSPSKAGAWTYTISAKDSSSTATSTGSFTAVASTQPGFVHRSAVDKKYLVRSDTNATFFAIGENIAWWTNGIHDYDNWVSKVASAGGNYLRIWIGATGFGFEIEGTLGNYDSTQQKAAYLDYLLDMAQSKGMTVMLCIDYHGDFSTTVNSNWGKNPYNSALGGPLSNPQYLWTDATTISYFKRRYRYIVARWAYSTAVHSWELWNEMDWIDNFAAHATDAGNWHSTMYSYIHTLDPFGHVITSSFAEDNNNAAVDRAIDFTQIHQYNVPDFAASVLGYIPNKLSQYGKPSFFGEMGVSWESGGQSETEDPTGISLHNVQWASLVFGACGGGFSWWWDSYVDPKNLYSVFTGITKFLVNEDLDVHGFNTVTASVSSSSLRSWALSGTDGRVLGWVQASAHTWSNIYNGGSVPTVSGATVKVPCANTLNNNTVEIWNTVSGTRLSAVSIACSSGFYTVSLPSVSSSNPDYAYKIYTGAPVTVPVLLGDWEFCSVSSQCADGCCSKQYSDDNQFKCTPGGTPAQCIQGSVTSAPTPAPTTKPTSAPPTTKPTSTPSPKPTTKPTSAPTPTPKPTSKPTTAPTSPPSNLVDWDFCTSSEQCADGCCSKQFSNDGKLKCTPGGSPNQCVYNPLLGDWEFCSASSQCADGCCSSYYSDDGKLKCTPGPGAGSSLCV